MALKCVGPNLYQLLESLTFDETPQYGDLIYAEQIDDGKLRFCHVEIKGNLKVEKFISSPAAITSERVTNLLIKLTEKGGYWQQDFGGILTLGFEAEWPERQNILDALSEYKPPSRWAKIYASVRRSIAGRLLPAKSSSIIPTIDSKSDRSTQARSNQHQITMNLR